MKFFSRSILILFLLFGLVFAIGDVVLAHYNTPTWIAILFPIALLTVQYLIAPWIIEHVYDIVWDVNSSDLPAVNREFIERLCQQRGLTVPKLGVIYDGTPNAFAYGRLRADARIVVTKGLLDVLTPNEVNAVLAHELGHVEHYDFAVMTAAAAAPLILYQLYVWTDRINNTRLIAYGAYFCYILSQFVVLLLNRTREYFADHYSAEVTHAPGDLSSALVKIAYGLVKADGEIQEQIHLADKKEKTDLRKQRRFAGSLALMGISNLKSGASLALMANPAEAAAVMRWDLVNPWAQFYELNSTHPLTALRIRELNTQAEAMHQAVEYPLPTDQRTHWGNFPFQFALWAAPVAAIVVLLTRWWLPELWSLLAITWPPQAVPALIAFAGFTWILRVWFRYPGRFDDATVGSLIRDVEVSQMKPRPVRLRGEILGRGVPGAFWSPDLTYRDETGMVFILYRQTIPFLRFLFAISAAEDYIGQKVTLEGWFRRGMAPYVEMSKLSSEQGNTHRAYSRWVQYAIAGIALVFGLLSLSGTSIF